MSKYIISSWKRNSKIDVSKRKYSNIILEISKCMHTEMHADTGTHTGRDACLWACPCADYPHAHDYLLHAYIKVTLVGLNLYFLANLGCMDANTQDTSATWYNSLTHENPKWFIQKHQWYGKKVRPYCVWQDKVQNRSVRASYLPIQKIFQLENTKLILTISPSCNKNIRVWRFPWQCIQGERYLYKWEYSSVASDWLNNCPYSLTWWTK